MGNDRELARLLDSVKALDPIQARIVLRDAYETSYGIYNHDTEDPSRPMALVALHPAENVTAHSRLYNTIRRYKMYDVKTHFGYNLSEFLELPREFTKFIFDVLAEEMSKSTSKQRQALEELQQLGGKGQS